LCTESINKIAKECRDIAAVVGAPSINPKIEGKNLYNSAYFLAEGKVQHIIHKSLLPTYDIFDEYRYFEPNKQFEIIAYKGKKIALTICEDLWDIEDDLMYNVNPMDELMKQNPDLAINIAASPFSFDHATIRKDVISSNAKKYKLPFYYVNHIGAQTELIFDGGSMVVNAKGDIIQELPYFEEAALTLDSDNLNRVIEVQKSDNKIELIHNAIVLGISDYFKKLGFGKAVLGLSGGIDSAVALALAARALGTKNVHSILMPSMHSSDHSVSDSLEICKNLGSSYDILNIEDSYKSFETTLHPLFKDMPEGLAEENLQARIRGVLLMAYSNKFGNIVLNTSNKSEAAVGYGTLYGDMCGGLSVIGDVYKIDVYDLARFINKDGEIIPENIITKPPSAELRPNQKDSDSLPEYHILDEILFEYIEKRKGPQEIIAMGFDEALVKRILRLVNLNEYKRYQTSPILRVSNKAFGMGRRMPIVGKYLS
jgi:NAD+ synthase (glutamine-hydrolysing)